MCLFHTPLLGMDVVGLVMIPHANTLIVQGGDVYGLHPPMPIYVMTAMATNAQVLCVQLPQATGALKSEGSVL